MFQVQDLDFCDLMFFWRGIVPINPDDTIASLGLQDGDIVNAVLAQRGC